MKTEIKVIFAAVLTLLASVTLAILNAVNANPALLGGLPAWLQFLIITVVPPVLAFLGGYLKPSSTSTVSDGFRGALPPSQHIL